MNLIPFVFINWHLLPSAELANARRSAAQGSLEPYTPYLPTHRHGLIKIVSHGPSNLRCLRPQWQLLAGFPPFQERVWSKWRTSTRRGGTLCLALQLSAVKLRHFFLTLTSSPYPIMLHSTPGSNSRVDRSRVHPTMDPLGRPSYLWSSRPQLPGNRQTTLPSILTRYFSLPMQKMTRNWTPLLRMS